MKKYQLFREWNDREIYGDDFKDALKRAGTLRRQNGYDCANEQPILGEEIYISEVVGREDVSNSKRGDYSFERLIVDTATGERIAIDGRFICDILPA